MTATATITIHPSIREPLTWLGAYGYRLKLKRGRLIAVRSEYANK